MLAILLLKQMCARRQSIRKQRSVKVDAVEHKTDKLESNVQEASYCRTCLSTDDLVSIFYNNESEEKRSHDLKIVTGLEIRMNDGLSQKICTQCIETMNLALQFRRTSKKAEKTLRSILSGKPKKKYSLRLQKSIQKTSKIKKPKVENVELEDFDSNLFGDDFQNDDCEDYSLLVTQEKPKLKQKPVISKKKRMTIPNVSSYKCNTCSKEFRMKATYRAHMRFHTNYSICESCGKRCRNNNQLQEHKRARHGLSRIHKCAYCEYSSATKEALTIHERRHTGERPYICDHCGSTFHRRSNLVQHIAVHLPEKNFQCPICSKWEKSKKLLQVHEWKAHRTQKYKYVCHICQDVFTRPGNVRQHLTRTHGILREHQGVIDRFEPNTEHLDLLLGAPSLAQVESIIK